MVKDCAVIGSISKIIHTHTHAHNHFIKDFTVIQEGILLINRRVMPGRSVKFYEQKSVTYVAEFL